MASRFSVLPFLMVHVLASFPGETVKPVDGHFLNAMQKEAFWRDGFLSIQNAVSPELLGRLNQDFEAWLEESQKHEEPFGTQLDGRPRFDLETNHSAEHPRLRRVASPTEISSSYLEALTDSNIPLAVADLIGPNLRLHHSKINPKCPHTTTSVDWHQEFMFDPHSNDDQVLALLFLSSVTEENGAPTVVPGSHRGPLFSIWQDGKFTGRIGLEETRYANANSISLVGPANTVALVHTRTLHSSLANGSDRLRNVFVSLIAAADAVPLAFNAVPSKHQGLILHGKEPGMIRSTSFVMEEPGKQTGASFFNNQEDGKIIEYLSKAAVV